MKVTAAQKRRLSRLIRENKVTGENLERFMQISETDILDKPVETLGLPNFAVNRLRMLQVKSVRDLVSHTCDEIIRLRNTGRVTVKEIEDKLAKVGLSLGMEV